MSLASQLPAATEVRRYRTRAGWLAARLSSLGASDVPKVLGLSPYGGPWSVWARKRGILEGNSTGVRARGHREEGRVLEDYVAATGARVFGPLGELHVVGPSPLAITPDAFEVVDGRLAVVEVKTDASPAWWGPSGMTIDRWTSDAAQVVREDYAAQVYAQLIATGLDEARLVVRRSLDDLRWYTIRRDDDTQARILAAVRSWWTRHIIEGRPPLTDDSQACADALRRIYPPTRRTRTATPHERALGVQAAVCGETRRLAERQERAAKAALMALAQGDSLTWPATDGHPAGRATITTHTPPQLRVSIKRPRP